MKIVLAYSGGLDTSIILAWLKEKYNAPIIAFCADIGQDEELDGLEAKALKTGASSCIIKNLQDEFARDFIYPMLRAGAIYEGQYFLGTSIARPLIAKHLVEIARQEKATAIAHGATGKGNDQVRFEFTIAALAPEMKVIAPWRTWDFRGRSDLMDYADHKQIMVPVSVEKPYSTDRNLLHISYECGVLEDPWAAPPKDMFTLTTDPQDAPDRPERVELEYERGDCVAVNGKRMTPAQVVRTLNKIAGRHGVGRVDIVENRFVGMKSRGVYETPGGTVLHFAHRQVETLTMDRDLMHLRDSLIPKYAELVYNGFWYAPEREFLQAAVEESQKTVSGTVRLKLYKGNIILEGRKSPLSLYNPQIATMEADQGAYNQADAAGFIQLNSLRLRARAEVAKRMKKAAHVPTAAKAKAKRKKTKR